MIRNTCQHPNMPSALMYWIENTYYYNELICANQ